MKQSAKMKDKEVIVMYSSKFQNREVIPFPPISLLQIVFLP